MAVTREKPRDIINRLRQDILRLQGVAPPDEMAARIGLGPVEHAFPHAAFPAFGVHEFISGSWEESAATCGFIGGLLAKLMDGGGVCLWVSTSGLLFPPALRAFGVAPDRVIFVEVAREQDVLWATEEALKCNSLVAVVAELGDMDFVQSRRLQLVVEKSRLTGLILRSSRRAIGTTSCVARWRITPLPSVSPQGMPGIGFPQWRVELLKVRNGTPGCWQVKWSDGHFEPIEPLRESQESHRIEKIS